MREEAAGGIAAAFKAAPPVGIAAATFAGIGLQDWVYALTIVYTLLMICQHVWSKYLQPYLLRRRVSKRARARRKRRRAVEAVVAHREEPHV